MQIIQTLDQKVSAFFDHRDPAVISLLVENSICDFHPTTTPLTNLEK